VILFAIRCPICLRLVDDEHMEHVGDCMELRMREVDKVELWPHFDNNDLGVNPNE